MDVILKYFAFVDFIPDDSKLFSYWFDFNWDLRGSFNWWQRSSIFNLALDY